MEDLRRNCDCICQPLDEGICVGIDVTEKFCWCWHPDGVVTVVDVKTDNERCLCHRLAVHLDLPKAACCRINISTMADIWDDQHVRQISLDSEGLLLIALTSRLVLLLLPRGLRTIS